MAEVNEIMKKPCLVSLIEGKKYAWCTCAHSKTQPFCDGSHKGTDMVPMIFKAVATEDVLLCACKATRSGPYCDGSHNNLEDTYAEASPEEIESLKNSIFIPRDGGETGKALLDGGAYVLTPSAENNTIVENIHYQPVISMKDGATKLSLHQLNIKPGTTPWVQYKDVDTVLYIFDGEGQVDISGKVFDVCKETGIYVCPGEKFRFISNRSMTVFAAVCPTLEDLKISKENATDFNDKLKERRVGIDPAKATIMANRFFQIMVDGSVGSHEVTQFIGEVPKSRAAMHRHLYEEAIVILTGEGRMWTGTMWAEVKPGDILFLPHRQGHSVECTSQAGMRLMGVFYPSGSPAINY